MEMTNGEITNNYRLAKYKESQIRKLAQLNACSEDRIREILREAGVLEEKNEKGSKKEKQRKNTGKADKFPTGKLVEDSVAAGQDGDMENAVPIEEKQDWEYGSWYVINAVKMRLRAIYREIKDLTAESKELEEYLAWYKGEKQ